MQHSLLGKSRFPLMAAILILSMISLCTFSREAGARSFAINGQKAFKMKVGDWDYVNITNLAGHTQYLTVTVIHPDASLNLQMLDINSNVVPLVNSVVLRLDSTKLDHGTLIFNHPSLSNSIFTTTIILSDGNPQSNDTITINIDDSQNPALKQIISILPAGPLTIPVGKGSGMAIELMVKNLTTNNRVIVSVSEPWGSPRFNPEYSLFYLNANPDSNTFNFRIFYSIFAGMMPDSALFIFNTDGASDTVKITMIDTVKRAPYISIEGKNFFGSLPGSQHCDNIIIGNANNIPVIISAMDITGANAADFILTSPAFPLTLDANSKLSVPFCYNAPNKRGTYSYGQFGVTYHIPGVTDYTATTTLYGQTVACLGVTPDTLEFGSTLAGGYIDRDVVISNTFDHTITLTKESWNDPASADFFSLIGTTLPVDIKSNESKTLTFHFAPAATKLGNCYGKYYLDFTGADDPTCTTMPLDLEGWSIDANDTSRKIYQLFPNVKSAMPIESDQQKTTKDFVFVNNSGNAVKVVSVSVKDGTHFAVVSPQTTDLPKTLQPNDQMTVTISFDANTNGFYDDELDIVTENGLTSQAFDLQAIRKNGTAAGVTDQKIIEPLIMLSPNPSHGPVAIAISDANIRSIDIYDMLGKLVASEKNTNLWMWDGKGISNEAIPDGTYFIRVSGVTTGGAPFVKTTKLLRK